MSQLAVESFLGRIITDEKFSARAAVSLEKACWAEGIVLSAEEMSCLKKVDLALLRALGDGLDGLVKRG